MAGAAVGVPRQSCSLEVNHRAPRRGGGYHAGCHHHPDGLETLCHRCHAEITAEQQRAMRPSAWPRPADTRSRATGRSHRPWSRTAAAKGPGFMSHPLRILVAWSIAGVIGILAVVAVGVVVAAVMSAQLKPPGES